MRNEQRRRLEKPNGKDLLAKLIDLYAEQEGVKIKYELEGVAA